MKFYIRYKFFKYLVIFLNLYNILVTFQHFINNIFREHLNIFILIYTNNLLTYSNNFREHKIYIYKTLESLKKK